MTAAPHDSIAVGDLVVCASRSYRAQIELDLDVGLFLCDRRRDGQVMFPGPGRTIWVPKRYLRAVPADDPRIVPPPAWLVVVNRAMRLLDAIDVKIEDDESNQLEVRIGCPGLDAALLARLEELLGRAARGLRIRPGSMSRVLVVFPAIDP